MRARSSACMLYTLVREYTNSYSRVTLNAHAHVLSCIRSVLYICVKRALISTRIDFNHNHELGVQENVSQVSDIASSVCPKIASQSYCLLLSEQEQLNSWILRLGKVGLVVSATGVRHPQPSLYEQRKRPSGIWFICPNIDFFGQYVFCATVRT